MDWILFGLLAAACFLLFQHFDLVHTGVASLAYLQGHFLDFYDLPRGTAIGQHYLPSTYLLFALWNIPLWLAGPVDLGIRATERLLPLMWYKLLPTLFYLASALVVARIAARIGLGPRKSRLAAFVWLTTPVAFFSQFIFGQYDALGVFFLLLGVYFYFKDDLAGFAVLFGVAFTFKYFALFIFVPLLLLKEKHLGRLFFRVALFAVPTLIVAAPYLQSPSFVEDVFGHQVASYVTLSSIWNGHVHLQLVALGWLLVCGWAYFVETRDARETARWAFFLANLSCAVVFGLAFFHPQWLLWATPFWVLGAFLVRKTHVFLALDVLLMLFFTIFTVTFNDMDVDQQLFGLGILRKVAQPILAHAVPMKSLFPLADSSLAFTAVAAIMGIFAIFKHPRFGLPNPARAADPSPALIRGRFLAGVALFVVPAFISLGLSWYFRPPLFQAHGQPVSTVGLMTDERDVAQIFVAAATPLTRLDFMPAVSSTPGSARLTLQIQDLGTRAVLYTTEINSRDLVNGRYYSVRLPRLTVTGGRRYAVLFAAHGASQESFLSLFRAADGGLTGNHYARIDGIRQPYDLMLRIYGK